MSKFVESHRPYVGVWKRVSIEEPIGTLAPESDQQMLVLWIQSLSGDFVDIRVPPRKGIASQVCLCKSFAGDISLKGNELTWKRVFDFRPTTGQDIGKNTFLADNILQEDGVLPGDNYREIWENICKPTSGSAQSQLNDFVAELTVTADGRRGGKVLRRGKFIVVGNHFACTLSRSIAAVTPTGPAGVDVDTSDDAILKYFAAGAEDAAMEAYLLDYVTVAGRVCCSDGEWHIDHALNRSFEGSSLLDLPPTAAESPTTGDIISSAASFANLLFSKNCQWVHTHGTTPDELFALCADRDVIMSKVHYPAGTYSSLVNAVEAIRERNLQAAQTGIGSGADAWEEATAVHQVWVGIVGSPGAGKSTLAHELQSQLERVGLSCTVIPMDGYHYYKAHLATFPDPQQAMDRRGAPFTFNSKKFVEDLKRARVSGAGKFPSFDHSLGDPVENDIELFADTDVVIVEGNYLCLPSSSTNYDSVDAAAPTVGDSNTNEDSILSAESEEFWGEIGSLLDMVCYLDYTDEDVIRSRLVERHMRVWNWTHEQAMERVMGNDLLNTRLIHAEGELYR